MLFQPRQKGLGRENFLKLNDQEEVTGVFRGDIYTFKRHWSDNRSLECPGSGCTLCSTGLKENFPSFRFRINFVTYKDGHFSAKIFEGGGETYDLLVSLDKKFDLSKTLVDITRRGLKQNTKFDFLPRVDHPITPEIEFKIKNVTLVTLQN
ncbi:hypothetical protein EBS43_12830 [bacterium]|nr:hypothetical protein [bacterium]